MTMKQASHAVVMTTVASRADAIRLANAAVKAKLAACVQFWPIRSIYHWEGKVVSGREVLLLCKTRSGCVTPLQSLIKAGHTYEVPEIVTLPITAGLPAYLAWITRESRPAAAPGPLTFQRQAIKSAGARKRGKS
jgi:periplasmic divalent cation tolerance protein